MKFPDKVVSLCLLLIVLASPVRFALAKPPPIVPLAERLTDFSGTLSADALSYLSSVIEDEENPGGPRLRVVVINSSAPESIDAYAERLLAAQPAKGGAEALLVIEPAARTARIAVNAAARPRLSPVAARVILRENVTYFLIEHGADGMFSAIEHGVRSMAAALRGEAVDGATAPNAGPVTAPVDAPTTAKTPVAAGSGGLVGIPPYATVSDLTGTLAPRDIAGLTSSIESLKARKGAQVAILMLASTKPESIEQFSVRAFEAWKPGRKGVDDDVLIVVAKDDRRVRIEVGYGLEGVLTDATASRIINEQMTPRFKQSDFAGGLLSGLERVGHVIEGEQLAPIVDASDDMPAATDFEIGTAIVVLALVARYWLAWYLTVLIGAVGTGGVLWLVNGPTTTTFFLACLAGALTFILPAVVLGTRRRSSGSGRSGSDSDSWSSSSSSGASSDGGGGSSGGGGASGGW